MTQAMEIKASQVQKLRQVTGAGLMECKQALIDAAGDEEKAIRILREKGIAKSSKRNDRVAGEGIVEAWISPDQIEGILLELNSETDFVARNEEFVQLAKNIIGQIKDNPSWTSAEQIPADATQALSAKVGEKMTARRFARYKANGGGLVRSYIHPGAKLGVLLQLDTDKPGAASPDLQQLAHEIALQIAAANPAYITSADIPADVIEREKDIAKKQMEGQKKPPEVLEKIAVGKLQQFYEAQCLMDQPHVRDTTGKTKIKNLIEETGKKIGATIKVAAYVRFRVGAD